MEQVNGIEPSQQAWEACVLPLNYTCIINLLYKTMYILSSKIKSYTKLKQNKKAI